MKRVLIILIASVVVICGWYGCVNNVKPVVSSEENTSIEYLIEGAGNNESPAVFIGLTGGRVKFTDMEDMPRLVEWDLQRLHPGHQVAPPAVVVSHQPGMVRGQIELARAAGDAGAAADAGQPLVLAQVVTRFPRRGVQALLRLLDLGEDAGQGFLRDLRVVAQPQQHLPLPLEFLQQVALQVSPRGDLEDLEQGRQRRVVAVRVRLLDEEAELVEQVLEAQQRAHALGEGVLV